VYNGRPGPVQRIGQVADIAFFALAPGRLRRLKGVAAFGNDGRHVGAELLADFGHGLFAALIFGGVVQQCGDSLRLGAICLDDQPGYRQQVPQVWDVAAFTRLGGVLLRRVLHGLDELRCQTRRCGFCGHALTLA
jgi:hypothetical protein